MKSIVLLRKHTELGSIRLEQGTRQIVVVQFLLVTSISESLACTGKSATSRGNCSAG